MKKIILYNLGAIVLLFLICEITCFFIGVKIQYPHIQNGSYRYILERYFAQPTFTYYDVPGNNLRDVSGKDYKKKPILLFGCSVTYGNLLNAEENFSGQLSKATKRPVYNLAYDGWTFSHMLKQLTSNESIKNLDPEYVIYTYIYDQRRRLHFIQGWPHDTEIYFTYTLDKDGNLKEMPKKYPFYYRFLTTKQFHYLLQDKKNNDYELTNKLMFKILEESTNIIKERYPNAKLIMLLYQDHDCKIEDQNTIPQDYELLDEEVWKEIEKMGFSIVNMGVEANKLFCLPEYRVGDNHHPSAKMWEEFVPTLVKKFKM